jgi:hypothetical protein
LIVISSEKDCMSDGHNQIEEAAVMNCGNCKIILKMILEIYSCEKLFELIK